VQAGYLAELRLDESQRGIFGLLRDGYRFFHEQQDDHPPEVYFTSIAADNRRALSLFERGVRGLPAYRHLADLETLLVAVPRFPRAPRFRVEPAAQEHVPAMLRLLNDSARRHQLGAVWTEEGLLSAEDHGLPLNRYLLALDGGAIIACGALWDQRKFRQTVICKYSMPLSLARPMLNAAGGIFGWPRLPRPGSILGHAFLSPLAFAEGAQALLPEFIGAFFGPAAQAGIEFVTLALPGNDERLPALRSSHITRTWRSRLYRVDWLDQPEVAIGGTILPDVALL
jgi:hypothetical protein